MKLLADSQAIPTLATYLCLLVFCCLLVGCSMNTMFPISQTHQGGSCQGNCVVGTGASGLSVIVEPDAGPEPLVDAIRGAKTSVWTEMYLLTNKRVLTALEDDANNGVDVRV